MKQAKIEPQHKAYKTRDGKKCKPFRGKGALAEGIAKAGRGEKGGKRWEVPLYDCYD